ncbi:MAG: restriction endonuclease [Candidatus Tectomicrobia bacterium]|nr:restriction endonuclease [Candidatus Tectomicrobia bacterium]
MTGNILFYGDNLDILRRHIGDETVDLIYLDPPFNSKATYNVLFAEKNGSQAAAQFKAFEDTWRWDQDAAKTYEEIVEGGKNIARTLIAFNELFGKNDMLTYLVMMASRLVELQRVLKPTGSIYLHCDPTASHYLKILMDASFGPKNFRNEIVWHYRKWATGKYAFQKNHDVLLFYFRSDSRKRTFNQLYMERAPSTLKRFGTSKIVSGHDETGRRVPSRTKQQESEGVRQDDVWAIGRVPPIKQLFPTQKPGPLLERIITSSSNENDLILDPFCGCGTTIAVAQRLHRRWIGIDITYLAITVIKHRLRDEFGEGVVDYKVKGEPIALPDAKVLAEQNPYEFQWWALGLVGARPVEQKKGADRGIDGRLYFHDEGLGGKTKQIIFSVKAGTTTVAHVRDLRGVIEREKAEIGVLITMQKMTQPMRSEAAGAGFYESQWGKHPRIQILTIEELLAGKRIDYPPSRQVNVTFKKAQKANKNESATQEPLL